jgi:hypothetical protein
MKPQAWAVIALAAVVGPVAWRFARRSRLALAIALVATTVAGLGVAFGALGYGGCAHRGDCGTVGGALRTVLIVAIMALAALLLFALARALWRRLAPRRALARGDAPRMRRRDIALAICGTVMALSSIAVIASSRAEDRPGGLAVVLFSAGILCVPLSGRLATRDRLLPRLDRMATEPSGSPATSAARCCSMSRSMSAASTTRLPALFRLLWQQTYPEMLRRVSAAGFDDIRLAHWPVLQWPGPGGQRPSVIAERAGTSKQAVNHVLRDLERLGYVELRPIRATAARDWSS